MTRSTYLAMVAMALGVFIIANDITAMNVALPSIEKDFDTSVTTVQWVVNAYALVFGVLIVTGGRLADLFGRREAFFVGAGIFLVASVAGATAQTESWLIAARAVQGIGGALIWPAVLGMTFALLPEEKAGLAGGLILGVAGIGNALGPMIGGALTEFASWRWILFLNVPICLAAITAVYFLIHQPRPETEDRKIDYGGIATVSLGLVLFMVALDQVVDLGWGDPRIVISVFISVVLLAMFGFIERRAGEHALVPKDVMRNPAFSAACVAILFVSATFFSVLFYVPQYLQKLGDLSAFQSGLGLLPFMAVFALTSFVAGPLYNRVGGRIIVTLGAAGIALGPLLLSFGVKESGSIGGIIPGLVVLGIGVGLFYSSATTIGVTAVDASRSSLAGGIIYMFQVAGGSVGLALTTTLFASASGVISGLHIAFRFNAIAAAVGFLIILFVVGPRVKPPEAKTSG